MNSPPNQLDRHILSTASDSNPTEMVEKKPTYPNRSQCVVILAPTPQDAYVCGKILRDVKIEAQFCDSIEEFSSAIAREAGAALVAQEHLTENSINLIKRTLDGQPTWSDFPLLVLLNAGEQAANSLEQLLSMGHVTLISRPLRIAVFINTLRARLRDRERQYKVRDLLTERQKAIELSRQDALRLELALRAGGMGAWEHRPNVVYWSPKLFDLFGYPLDIVPTVEAAFMRVHSEDVEELKRKWNQAIEHGHAFQHEFRIQHPNRGVRWLAAVGEPVKSKSGKVLRYAGVNWDITERREYEHSLQEARHQAEVANQSKSAFLANMSHEIRTPMTAILGYADLIAEQISNVETLAHVQTIRRNGAFLLEIINDILDLSKIEAGKFEIMPERFSAHRLVEDVRSIMQVRAREGNLKLSVEYRREVPAEIESDPKRLKQILINLVGNAIKFTKQGGVQVIVTYLKNDGRPESQDNRQTVNESKFLPISKTSGWLQFEIVDSGIGISETQQDRLFQPFSQGDHSVNREFGGTGLGLAISQRLVAMLGGSISIESEEGKGSTFIFSISVGDIENVEMIKPKFATERIANSSQSEAIVLDCHVLVVDDRREIRFLTRKFLSDAGAKVHEATDGELAVQAVKESMLNGAPPDIIILDMQMPKLDGYEAAQTLRRLGYAGPIIALTADAMQGDMTRCIECGCNDYLSKPIDKAALLQKIQQFVGKKNPSVK